MKMYKQLSNYQKTGLSEWYIIKRAVNGETYEQIHYGSLVKGFLTILIGTELINKFNEKY